ncbi:MAG: RNA polymerase sigma factor [Mariniblastus sp.]
MTDSELLKVYISERDEHAFAEIVLRYERLVWSVCYRLLINHNDREDAFQDTFLVLAKNAHRIKKPDSMSNWLHSVAWKTASRMRKRRAILSLDVYLENGNEVPAATDNQLDQIARLNEFELVNRRLQSMPSKHRTPLILFYYSGLTTKQIACQLNLTVAATEGRLRRAREKLRTQLRTSREFDSQTGVIPPANGAALLLLGGAIKFNSNPMLILTTVQKSLATNASVSVGATSGTLNLGYKLMICKYACAAGISGILALAGWMHSGDFQDARQSSETAQIFVNDSDADSKTVPNQIVVDSADCDKIPILGDLPHIGGIFSRSNLERHHEFAALHVQKFCEMIGCCKTDED